MLEGGKGGEGGKPIIIIGYVRETTLVQKETNTESAKRETQDLITVQPIVPTWIVQI